jgi:hypothetical protein
VSTPVLLIDGTDYSCHALFPVVVTRGRDHPAESFAPGTLTLNLDGPHRLARGAVIDLTIPAPDSDPRWETAHGTWPEQIGTWLDQRITLELFHGRVTDLDTGWEPLGPREWRTTTRIVAVDPIGELVNVPVGDTPWPAESGTDRASRIAALVPWLAWSIDPAPQMLAARDVDSRPALELLDRLTQSVSAVGGVWFDPGGRVAHVMSDASRPHGTAPSVTLGSCDLLPATAWVESVGDVVNDATVTYVGAGGTSLEARSSLILEGDSAGRRHETISTDLTGALEAQLRAHDHTSRYGRPAPRLRNMTLTSRSVTSRAAAEWILKALPTDLVRIKDLPPPAPSTFQGFTEGWTLTLEGVDLWSLAVGLSPQIWSGLFLTWSEVASAPVLSSDAWLKPAGWQFFGFGYGHPGGTITAAGAALRVAWGLPPQAPNDQAAQLAARNVPVTAGRRYRLEVAGTLEAGSPRVRATVGYTASGPWSAPAPGPFTSSIEWTATTTRNMAFGLESQAGPQGGAAVITAIQLTDITDSDEPGRWQDAARTWRWFDATAEIRWI